MGSVGLGTLLLADGRFPAGGHAHSAGVEAAVADGRVVDTGSLEEFVRGRLWTAGLTEAALAAATVERLQQWSGGAARGTAGNAARSGPGNVARGAAGSGPGGALDDGTGRVSAALRALDAEADARIAPHPLRAASRRLGRQMLRAAGRCWPVPLLGVAKLIEPVGLHQPVALGVAAVAAGVPAREAAAVAVHHVMVTPAQAGVRLLGLDPFDVTAVVAGLSSDAEAVVDEALSAAGGPLAQLPSRTGALVDIAAIHHAGSDRRLFAT